jgi:hypothetical protein
MYYIQGAYTNDCKWIPWWSHNIVILNSTLNIILITDVWHFFVKIYLFKKVRLDGVEFNFPEFWHLMNFNYAKYAFLMCTCNNKPIVGSLILNNFGKYP